MVMIVLGSLLMFQFIMALTSESAHQVPDGKIASNQTIEIKYAPYKSVFEILEETKGRIRDLWKPEVDDGEEEDDIKIEPESEQKPDPIENKVKQEKIAETD